MVINAFYRKYLYRNKVECNFFCYGKQEGSKAMSEYKEEFEYTNDR
jgi:hypothetical protein